jgi:hypothetical protein
MTESFFNTMFEQERQEMETYARGHGYTIQEIENGLPFSRGNVYYVWKQEVNSPLALSVSQWAAIRIAYALAKTFPAGGGAE